MEEENAEDFAEAGSVKGRAHGQVEEDRNHGEEARAMGRGLVLPPENADGSKA